MALKFGILVGCQSYTHFISVTDESFPDLMVGGDVYDDGDERPLPVRLGDDPVGEQTARRLVLPDRRVPAVSGVISWCPLWFILSVG